MKLDGEELLDKLMPVLIIEFFILFNILVVLVFLVGFGVIK